MVPFAKYVHILSASVGFVVDFSSTESSEILKESARRDSGVIIRLVVGSRSAKLVLLLSGSDGNGTVAESIAYATKFVSIHKNYNIFDSSTHKLATISITVLHACFGAASKIAQYMHECARFLGARYIDFPSVISTMFMTLHSNVTVYFKRYALFCAVASSWIKS